MDNENRSEGRLPSYPGTRQHQEILPVCCSRNSLPIQGSPIWSLNGSERVHKDPSSCCSSLTFSRHPGPCISGRLDHPCFIQRSESSSYSTSPTTSSVTGMDNKLGQIYVTALPHSGLSGPPLQFRISPNTVKCHYNACHYNANASLTRSILGSQTAPTCPHDHPRVAQHMGKRCEIIAVWSATAAMTPLCSHTNGMKQRYPTCWLCQYSRFMIDLRSNTLIIHLRCSENAINRPIWLPDARMLKTISVVIKLT